MSIKTPYIWIGNKTRLFSSLAKHLPENLKKKSFTGSYFEPFCGSCSMYLNLKQNGYLDSSKVSLTDTNYLLIASLLGLQKSLDKTLMYLRMHEKQHSKEYFKSVLNVSDKESLSEIAGRYLYINRGSHGGLYRENSNYDLNMPGRIKYVPLPDITYHIFSHHIQNCFIATWSYEAILENAVQGDFVYLDPPYADFTGSKSVYGHGRFNQEKLKEVCDNLTGKGVYFLQSNSWSDEVFDLYQKDYEIDSITVKYNNANGTNNNTREVDEVVIKNY